MPEVKDRIESLRALMRSHNIEAYLIPSSDPHQNEYVPEFWQRRKFISGFTGSAGEVAVTLDGAGLWVDSRYFIQAEEQLDKSVFTLFKMGMPDVPLIRDWLAKELKKGDRIGIDPRVIAQKSFRELVSSLKRKGIEVVCISDNLVDQIWEGKPAYPKDPIFRLDTEITGSSVKEKLGRLRDKMKEEAVFSHIITKLDSLAWLFNIRGSDIRFNPVAIAYAIVTVDNASLFISAEKVPVNVRQDLENDVNIKDYDDFPRDVKSLRNIGPVWVDEPSVSRWVMALLGEAETILKPSPIDLFKSIKNPVEVEGMRQAHVRDGVAMVKFLRWLENTKGKETITELSAADKAREFRADMDFFRGMSFETISSFGPHGAIVHYAVTPDTDIPLGNRGIYLLDSGGQYLDGTTDITRTISLGAPTEEEKDRFTRVLKGLITLTSTPFPKGTVGKQLEVLARQSLWELGLNYLHGTGHGLGHYLYVHEGPQAISYRHCIGVALEPGMVNTIEPGFYKEGDYGIRIENAALVIRDEELSSAEQEFFRFETLTLCPIDRVLINRELLYDREKQWLNDYHAKVLRILSPLLSPGETDWLATATQPI
jgi:Xaa-Pro aminopeptidase